VAFRRIPAQSQKKHTVPSKGFRSGPYPASCLSLALKSGRYDEKSRLAATQILEVFSRRWPLEVCFRDVKQFLGFEDPQNWVAKATTRTAPLIFFIYDLALLWYAQSGYRLAAESALDRLWYPQKASVSFEDILRTLRYATWQERIFNDPTLDAHTRKILQPFVDWAKGLS
jgi:hypothetical protein